MNTIRVHDHTGDTMLKFDPKNPELLKEAQDLWNDFIERRKFRAYEKNNDGGSTSGKLVREFNPTATETLYSPHLSGG